MGIEIASFMQRFRGQEKFIGMDDLLDNSITSKKARLRGNEVVVVEIQPGISTFEDANGIQRATRNERAIWRGLERNGFNPKNFSWLTQPEEDIPTPNDMLGYLRFGRVIHEDTKTPTCVWVVEQGIGDRGERETILVKTTPLTEAFREKLKLKIPSIHDVEYSRYISDPWPATLRPNRI